MARPVTLFTGQWADLPLTELAPLAKKMGFDGLELACWGDGYQGLDYVKFIGEFKDRIYHAHMKDAWWGHGNGDIGVFGGHTDFGDHRRYWDFRSIEHGDIRFEDIIVALNDTGYRGPLSIEWEDIRMDRLHAAAESCKHIKSYDFTPSSRAFDAAFDREKP